MPKVDMSDKAVTARLKRVSQLRRLSLSLGSAKIKGAPAKRNMPAAIETTKPEKRSGK